MFELHKSSLRHCSYDAALLAYLKGAQKLVPAFVGVLLLILSMATVAQADPVVTVAPSNVGITNFSYSFDSATRTITIHETWGNAGPGVLQITGLDNLQEYKVVTHVTNNSGVAWDTFSDELTKTNGQLPDRGDILLRLNSSSLYPLSVNTYTLPQTTPREYVDLYGATAQHGSVFTVELSIRQATSVYPGPLLLIQTPNQPIRAIPEPTSIALLCTGVLGLMAHRRRRSSTRKENERSAKM
jgi:hypothetical protein